MKDFQRTPIIINLEKCATQKIEIVNIVKKRFDSTKTHKSLERSSKNDTNTVMMSECDDLLKNDFKWLMNFNLKEIPIHDIDEESPSNELLKRQVKRRRRSFSKHKHKLLLSDAIEQCLFIKDRATIGDISKWISDSFPCFKSNGCTWKSSIRKTLLKNPIFKRKKLKLGKSDLWCLDENYLPNSNYVKQTLHQNTNGNNFKEYTAAIDVIKECIFSDKNALTTTNVNEIPVRSTDMHTSATWIKPKDGENCIEVEGSDLIECYEVSAEFQEGNKESLEVHFLDENNLLLPIELIQY